MKNTLDKSQVLPPPLISGARGPACDLLKAQEKEIQTKKGRTNLYLLRNEAGLILGNRAAKCGRLAIFKDQASNIGIFKKNNDHFFYSGLETCGSVWTCPVCALKITYDRAKKVAKMLKNIQDMQIYSIGFLTLTIKHEFRTKLSHSKTLILKAYRKITKSRKYLRLCSIFNIKGNIRALEIKYSIKTGWHPHLHILYVGTCNKNDLELFGNAIIDLFLKETGEKAGRQGQKYLPILNIKGIKEYLTKWKAADEICKGHTKTKSKAESFTPFEMLDFIRKNKHENDQKARVKEFKAKFLEFYQQTKGTKQLTISENLEKFNFDLDFNKTDEEISREKQKDVVEVIKIDHSLFRKITKNNIQSDILNIIQYEPKENLILFLQEFGIFSEIKENLISEIEIKKINLPLKKNKFKINPLLNYN